ncbi:MAG: hypothetical protein QOI04_2225 [Verrucomicrobiota bacterium]|jgi:hypothetical protein
MRWSETVVFRHRLFIGFIIFYAAVVLFQLPHGLASLDAHGIVAATRSLLENHRVEISRPPGHPTTEFYIFGTVGWFLQKCGGLKFDDAAYLVSQSLAALATLVLFYELVLRAGAERRQALLAVICLAFSAQYFQHAVDGEEFIFALFFILLAVRLLIVPANQPVSFGRMFMSILSFALATGCRPEVLFAGVMFPVGCALHPKLGWKWAVASLVSLALAIGVVWLPIIFHGVRWPYQSGMSSRESILGGGYKLIFQSFTLPVFVLLCWIWLGAAIKVRDRMRQPFPTNFLFAVSCLLPLIFFALFFRYATKPAYILITLPFFLLLALERAKAVLVVLTALTLLGVFVSVDIFKDRQLTRPFLTSGTYFAAVHAKPYYKLGYLRELERQCDGAPAVIIGNAWPWDFEYHLTRGTFFAREEVMSSTDGQSIPAFFPGEKNACLLLPRDAAFQTQLLEGWQAKGYALKMDAELYRVQFAKYDVTAPVSNSAKVGPLSFTLFPVNSTAP